MNDQRPTSRFLVHLSAALALGVSACAARAAGPPEGAWPHQCIAPAER